VIEQRPWPRGADDGVNACQSAFERCIIFDFADMNFNAAISEL
jgi:hypothetical protein